MTDSNKLQDAVRWFRRALQPLIDATVDPAAERAVREAFQLPPATAVPQVPSATVQKLDAFAASNDPTLAAAADVTDDLIALAATVRDLIAAGINAPGNLPEEMAIGFLGIYGLNVMRHETPGLYGLFRFLGFITENLTTHYTDSLHTDRIVHFVRDAGGYLRSAFTLANPADAQALGDAVLFPLAAALRLGVPGTDVLYGWDPAPRSTTVAADAISRRTLTVGIRGRDTAGGAAATATLLLTVIPVPAGEGGPGVFAALGGSQALEIPVAGGTWTLAISVTASDVVSALFAEESEVFGLTDASVEATLRKVQTEGSTRNIVGGARGTRFEYGDLSVGLELAFLQGRSGAIEPVFDVHMLLHDASFVFKADADGFLARVFGSEEIRVPMELGVGYASNRGVYLTGAPGLKVTLPISARIGPIRVIYIALELRPTGAGQADGLAFEALAGVSLKICGFTAVVDQVGVVASIGTDANNDLELRPAEFKPPRGIGLAVNTCSIKGGGYLFHDPDNGQYAGVVSLSIKGVVVTGIGIISTIAGPPERDSVLVLVSAEWPKSCRPGIADVTLVGVGLLVGANRSVNTDRLLSGVKDGLLDSLLFPADPVAKAPQIVSNLTAVFPMTSGHTVIGAALKFEYGRVVTWATSNLALAVEMGEGGAEGPLKWIVLGQVKVASPPAHKPVIRINIDLVGIIDPAAQLIAFNASLVDSKVGTWTVTGDAAFRWRGGPQESFLLALGGFHPGFEAPGDFPKLERLAISLSDTSGAEVRCEAYAALTSNSVQFGAKAGAILRAGGFSLQGHLSFDALIDDDGCFKADAEASIALKRGSTTILSAQVTFALAGPGRWEFDGKVKVSFFFVSFTVHFHTTFGTAPNPEAITASVDQALTAATADPRSWHSALAAPLPSVVALRSLPPSTDIFVHPLADLAMQQRIAPLNVELARLGSARISGPRQFTITEVLLNGTSRLADATPVRAMFAPGQFFDLTDEEKLSSPSYEMMDAGVRISTGAITHGPGIEDNVVYETIVLDPNNNLRRFRGLDYRIPRDVCHALTATGAAATAAAGSGSFRREGPPVVQVVEPAYTVVRGSDLQPIAGGPSSYAAARQELKRLRSADPAADVFLVGAHEARP